MTVVLDDHRRAQLIAELQALYLDSFDEQMSAFRAEQVLDFFLGSLGPQVYNQAVKDARAFFQQKLDDLDGEVYEPEGV
jgi:uncharacterized protein (DUF2164 family)